MTRSLLRHSSKTHIHKNASFPVGVSDGFSYCGCAVGVIIGGFFGYRINRV